MTTTTGERGSTRPRPEKTRNDAMPGALGVMFLLSCFAASCMLQDMGMLEGPGADARPDGDGDVDVDSDSDTDADSDADDGGCPAGQVPCDGECVDLDSDPDHCGACDRTCPDGSHAEPACSDSTCTLSCNRDWDDCDGLLETGCEANLTSDETNCGVCGLTCPTSDGTTARCSGGRCASRCSPGFVELGDQCAAFGGAFVSIECEGLVCRNPNVYTGACSCPPGFAATDPPMRIKNDCSATESHYAMADLRFCSAPERADAADWAGAYLRDPSSGCRNANPYTGTCSCPGDVFAIELPAEREDAEQIFVGVCFDDSAPTTSFAGAYEVADSGECLVAHPATEACACPAETTPIGLRAVSEYHWPGGDTGDWGTSIVLCVI